MSSTRIFSFLFFLVLLVFCTYPSFSQGFFSSSKLKKYTTKVIKQFPHNKTYFTQGLVYQDGLIYESTGLYGESKIVVYDLESQTVDKKLELEKRFFGEGLAIHDETLVQLTYKARKGFVYDKQTLKKIREFRYKTEGWGLTTDGRYLIMSDGSEKLYFLDDENFKIRKKISVKKGGQHIYGLNELEYIDGLIYSNIWKRNIIIQINPKNGKVVGEIDLGSIAQNYKNDKNVNVLNGIAWDKENERLFVTGKRWPHLYHIELVRK